MTAPGPAEGERVAIFGLGLIGGSLCLALAKTRPDLALLGVDADPQTRALALEAGAVAQAFAPDEADLSRCALVVLAVPAAALLELLEPVARRMAPGAVLTDVCGGKDAVCRRGASQDRVVFVGAHPMAGTEFRGFGAASAGLFAGATVALCPPCGGPDGAALGPEGLAAAERVKRLWRDAGAAKLLPVDPEQHDRAVTFASHLPYLAAASVVQALGDAGADAALARELAAGGFRDTTRVAGDGTVAGAAALNRFLPGAARKLAEALRAFADELERAPAEAAERLAGLADVRRAMKLPGVARRG